MAIAREIVTWAEGGSLVSRLATNAPLGRVRASLLDRGLSPWVDRLEGDADPTRLSGGHAVMIRWNRGTCPDDVRGRLGG